MDRSRSEYNILQNNNNINIDIVRTLFCFPRPEQVSSRLLPHPSLGGLDRSHSATCPEKKLRISGCIKK